MTRLVCGRSLRIATSFVLVAMLLASQAVAAPSDSWVTRVDDLPVDGAVLPAEGVDLPAEGAGKPESAEASFAPDEVLVRFRTDIAGTVRGAAAHARVGGVTKKRFGSVEGLELVKVAEGMTVDEAVAAYSAMPGVLSAQPNYRYELAGVPDDALFGRLWGFDNTGQDVAGIIGTPDADIDAPEAWDITTGSADVVVAVVDTGIDYNHPELAANIWVNEDEIAGNGVDDDANGYIDDVHGIDSGDDDADPMDRIGHGTHVAGTIGAVGDNGVGVAGVNWDVRIMPVKIFDSGGSTYTSYILEGLEYARAQGARVVNCSWGGSLSSSDMYALMQSSPNQLFVCAAGNANSNMDTGTKFYPAAYDLPNVLSVGASDANDVRATFSNYGTTTVDVFAPGANVTSTLLGTEYLRPADSAASTIVLSDDFATTGAWVCSEGATGSTPWALTTLRQRTEPSSLGVFQYHDDEVSYADTVLPLDLTGTQAPWLEFYMGLDTEPGYDYASWGLVDKSTVPETYVELGRDSGASAGETDHYRVDLSDFAGTGTWNLRFTFASDTALSSADGYLGAWIDDVKVSDVTTSGVTLYENAIDYASAMSATTDWTTARSFVAWAYSSTERDWYYSSSQAAENTWLFLKAPLNLASGPAELSFDAKYQLSGTYGRSDALGVYASADGIWDTRATSGNTLLGSFSGTSPEVRRTVSLADFAGDDTVWIAFQLVTAMSSHAVSARLDDLQVTGGGWARDVDYTYAYDEWNGTSMAAPHAVGVAGLLLARNPLLTTAELKSIIMESVDMPPALEGLCVTGGRVNAFSALSITNVPPVAVADAYATTRDTMLTVPSATGLLANDYDPAPEQLPLALAASDLANAHGVVTFTGGGTDGSFTYAPEPGFVGEASFTYTVSDAGGLVSGPGLVRITVRSPNLVEVYRFYNRLNGSHFYTASSTERALVNATWPHVYADEGVAYSLNPARNDAPLHRFYNRLNGSHFYTVSEEEKAHVIATWPDVYTYEGVAYYVALTDGPFTQTVHRFYNVRNGSHFYTASAAEKAYVVAIWPEVYQYEGIGFYVRQ